MNNSININRIANGWLVQLPDQSLFIGDVSLDSFAGAIKNAGRATDEVMERIRREEEQKPSIDIPQNMCEHYFESLPEALEFIRKTFSKIIRDE